MHLLRQPSNAELQAQCLSTDLCAGNSAGVVPVWVQLIPEATNGLLVAKDGRKWTVKDLTSVIAATMARHPGGICMDFNHGTDLAAKEGHEAPAAAWIKELAAQGPEGQPGLWGKPDWTKRGREAVADGDYRFLSPVIISRKSDNLVVSLDRCALTNDPALYTQNLFHNTTTENNEVKISAALAAALGLTGDVTEEKAIETAKGLCSGASHLALIAAAGGIAKETAITDDLVTGLCTKLKAPAATGDAAEVTLLRGKVDQLNIDLASLRGDQAKTGAAAKVEAAITAGKLPPAQKDWAIDYCSRDAAGFDAFISKQPALLADGQLAPSQVADGELTSDQKALCATLSVSETDFKAELAAQKGKN